MTDPHVRGGGQVRYVRTLSSALQRLGHDVTVGSRPDSVIAEHARAAGLPVSDRFAFRGGLRPHAWWNDIGVFRRHILTAQPDVIHVSGSQDHWSAALATRRAPACLVRTRHNTYPVKDHWPNRVLNRRWTDYQIVVCDVVRRDLAGNAAFDAARMESIHNGVDAEAYKPDEAARASARAEFGYGDEDFVVGIAARLNKAKGHAFLFQAVAVLRECPQLRVLVLGEGGLESDLRAQVAELGIADRVCFAGFREDMPRCVQAFDCGVQPSIDCDTSSFSLKEQMAAAKPVIASDYGGLTEIVTDGVEGYVAPAGAVEPLSDALRRVIENPGAAKSMGAAGRERVLREFSEDSFAIRTVAAYRRAMAIHANRRRARR